MINISKNRLNVSFACEFNIAKIDYKNEVVYIKEDPNPCAVCKGFSCLHAVAIPTEFIFEREN